jgi:hypothetical protein
MVAWGRDKIWRVRGAFDELEIELDPRPTALVDDDAVGRTRRHLRALLEGLDDTVGAHRVLVEIYLRMFGVSGNDDRNGASELASGSRYAQIVGERLDAAASMGRLVVRVIERERVPAQPASATAPVPIFIPLLEAPEAATSWIGLALVDQNEAPVPGRPYRVVAADSQVYEGTLDEEGTAVVQGLENGLCRVSCPAATPHPSLTYTVQDGDHISGIAQQFGFDDYTVVWNRPENADLRALRDDPHVLAPGDQLFIPELKDMPVSRKTGDTYTFDLSISPLRLRIQLLDLLGNPVAGAAVTAANRPFTTDGNGVVGFDVAKTAQSVDLDSPVGDISLDVADLNPTDDDSDAGWKARLMNLGFLWDPTVDDDDDEMVIAVQDFQAQYDLPVTGELDDATKAQLVQAYGC